MPSPSHSVLQETPTESASYDRMSAAQAGTNKWMTMGV
jgi:hypothetical protein